MKKFLVSLCMVAMIAALAIGAFAAETVIYENDFSDPSTLSDFKQYRMVWEIKDGGLYLTDSFTTSEGASVDTSFAHIIYQAKETYKDYILEVDYMNVQTAGGIIFRADQDAVTDKQNGFQGYVAFVANNANCVALGSADNANAWKGNINVGKTGNMNIASDVHIKVTVKGDKIHVLATNLQNGKTVYDYSYTIGSNAAADQGWTEGTFGLRMRAGMKANDAYSAGVAYFDNFKVTTANEATVAGGTTTTPTTPAVNPTNTIDTSNLVPVYTNTFDTAADIKDFVQYRGTWAVYGGQLYLSAGTEGAQSYILYAGDAKLTELKDYVVDVDMNLTQTQGGIIMRSDLTKVTGAADDAFYGYMGFISNDGTLGALGACQADGKWLTGNIEVSKACLTPGSNIHLQMAAKGNLLQLTITDKASGKVLWQWCESNNIWNKGTFGFRLRSKATNAGLNNLNATSFDNLVISTFGEAAPKTEVKLTINSTTAYINGKAQTLDAAPINRNNRTMLPVRFLANAFGVANDGIKWSAETRTATLSNATTTIVVTIDKPYMTVNGQRVELDSPAIIESNRTYLPVRAIANALGVSNDNIAWDAKTNTATLVK